MIDYEFRLITNTIKIIVRKKIKNERILLSKIDKDHISEVNLFNLNAKYFKRLETISGIVYRGLPINNSKYFFSSEKEVEKEFNLLKLTHKKNLKGYRLIQFPNPNYISLKLFKKFVSNQKFFGFEVIPEWHKNTSLGNSYDEFFNFAQNSGKPVAVETSFSHKQLNSSHFHLLDIVRKFPKLKLIFPKFGAGIFLYPFILKKLRYKPVLISSAPKSMKWLKILKINDFNKLVKVKFGTDHPLNGNTSFSIYKNWLNFYEKKK